MEVQTESHNHLHKILPAKISHRLSLRNGARNSRPECILPGCPLTVPRPFFVGYCAPHRCEDQNRDGTQCMAACRVWRIAELVTPKSHIEQRFDVNGKEIPGKAKLKNGGGGGISTDGSVHYRHVLSPFCRFHEPERLTNFAGARVVHHLKTYSSKASSLRAFYRKQMCLHADHGGRASTVRAFRTEDTKIEDGIVTIYPTCWDHLPEGLKKNLASEGLGEAGAEGAEPNKAEGVSRSKSLSNMRASELRKKRVTLRKMKDEGAGDDADDDEMDWEWDASSYGGRIESVAMFDLGRQGLI